MMTSRKWRQLQKTAGSLCLVGNTRPKGREIWRRKIVFLLMAMSLNCFCTAAWPSEPSENEDTLLMFVGEDLDVLTIATRHEQSAGQAPAVAQVITRQQIQERGVRTLSQALSMVPGFHMAQREWGAMPYMRGIANSILFLYDSVPLGSTVTKSLSTIDHEVSLVRVKRIEIIRGPGSVLWGPDAYAAIVNIVPVSASDLQDIEAGVSLGGPGDQKEAFFNLGHNTGRWNAMLSLNGRKASEDDTVCNLVRFWGDGQIPEAPENRVGSRTPDDSNYLEALASFNFENWLHLSARISDSEKNYAMAGEEGTYTWPEAQQVSAGYLKAELSRKIDLNRGVRFQMNYQWLNPDHTIIDRTVSCEESALYGELIFDQSFLSGRGLFTGGLSYRESSADQAPIWDGYLNDFLDPENELFLPVLTQEDHDSDLRSLFSQYTHKFDNIDLLASVRHDDHDRYDDTVSYNLGLVWSFLPDWTAKILYGTAYRTPFARQLAQGGTPSPEKIGNLSMQVTWKPAAALEMSLTGYHSRIDHHVMEDPYAGLSEPNWQKIDGLEAEVRFSPLKSLEVSANFSALANSGPDETYLYNDYSYIDENGDLVKHYEELQYPYDPGPKQTFNLAARWQALENTTIFSRLQYTARRRLIYPLGNTHTTASGVWLLDLGILRRRFPTNRLDLGFTVLNLLDEKYDTPGTYTNISGAPFTCLGTLTIHF